MKNRLLVVFTLAVALSLQTGFVWAGDATENLTLTTTTPTSVEKNAQLENQEEIYGVQLMTPQERSAFRTKMSGAKTLEEQEKIRNENHRAMQERAQSHGLNLPDQVPAGKRGMDQGSGMINQNGSMMNQSDGIGHGGGLGSGGGHSQ